MANAPLTFKGQTTIPKEAQDQLNFTLMPDGTVLMQVKNRKLQDLAGAAHYSGPVIGVDDMKLGG